MLRHTFHPFALLEGGMEDVVGWELKNLPHFLRHNSKAVRIGGDEWRIIRSEWLRWDLTAQLFWRDTNRRKRL